MQARQLCALLLAGGLAGSAVAANAQDRGWRDQQEASGRQMRFRNMDTDRDGVITRAEWRGSLQSFRQQDTNDDNVLSGAEVWDAQQNANDQDMSRVFERADRNNDRLLSRDEWYGDLNTFERIDANDDGRISLSEFLGDEVAGTTGQQEVRTPAYRAGFTRGLAEGRQAGREDKTVNGGRWDLEGQRELVQADSGYTQSVGPRDEYQSGYRVGFRRGYAQGFGPR